MMEIHVSIGEQNESVERHRSCNTGLSVQRNLFESNTFHKDFGNHRSATESVPKKDARMIS